MLHFTPDFFFFSYVFMHLFDKILDGKANSVDPDQTALEQSDLGLHYLHMPFCQIGMCMKFLDS